MGRQKGPVALAINVERPYECHIRLERPEFNQIYPTVPRIETAHIELSYYV
jgi:hypothetical protein